MTGLARDDIDVLRRQLARERAARKTAESLLESKGLALFQANEALEKANSELEQRVAERVSELHCANQQLRRSELRLRAAAEEAEAASRVKSEFLAKMSHEIRTPMTAILGYADMLSRKMVDGAEVEETASAIRRNADHLLVLLNDILDLSKIEAGQMALQLDRCRLLPVFDELRSMMAMRAEDKQLQFDIGFEERLPTHMRTDRTRFQQILVNLVSNAIKFTDQGAVRVAVSVDDPASGPMLVVSVEDTGSGIAADELERIFEPFTQGSNALRSGGTGLGLDISRRLARLLGGEITAASTPGRGSTFRLRVPLEHGLADEAASAANGDPGVDDDAMDAQHALGGRHLLLVDDNLDNERIISFILLNWGAAVEIARDGAEAMRKIVDAEQRGERFDLVLMDMEMPVMDGYTAVERLRKIGVDLPILALTAHAMIGDEERCLRIGCNAYLSKPVVPEVLLETIRKSLEARRPCPKPATPTGFAASPAFAKLRQQYVGGLPSVIDEIRAAMSSGDTGAIRSITHRLKGTGANYGFPELSEVAGRIEGSLRLDVALTDVTDEVNALIVCLEEAARA
ncbi:MAG: ATP-binding protein [Planctomycetota bacterium]|jgi:signal transduction histidine kinase/HPt (histidine-containing phosphotransfer) domain-containing protein/ActR/RegA family two-component response regulator